MNPQTENTRSQMKKGLLEYCILLLLKHNEMYPSDMLEELKKSRLIVVEGTLYPLLTRLKNNGYLSYRWEESTQGPPRKYYSITASGKDLLHSLNETWKELTESIEDIKKNNQKH